MGAIRSGRFRRGRGRAAQGLAAALLVALGLAACGRERASDHNARAPQADTLVGAIYDPKPAAPLRLTDGDGRSFEWSAQRGRVVLVFFGFTACPDVCPRTLERWAAVRAALGADASNVRFVFASVDPARDTPAIADAYAKRFHPSFLGLSGTRAQVDATVAAWGVVLGPGGAPTHTAQVFMVGPDGKLARGYGQSATVEQIVALIRSFDARAARAPAAHAVTSLEWAPLGRGVDYATATVDAPGPGDADFRIVRIDPSVAKIQPALASKEESSRLTAGAWCEAKRFVATINLGMFQDDGLSNVGYCRVGRRVFSSRWVSSYKSLFVAGARKPELPAATLLDLDRPGARERAEDYDIAIQNLRLIRSPGVGVWERQPKRWSEAAVAEGDGGRLYFIFLRRALAMADFNDAVLALPLGIRTAMHVEGGPEASLSIRGVSASRDFSGSFETGFHESDDVSVQWPIPNVLGVVADAGD